MLLTQQPHSSLSEGTDTHPREKWGSQQRADLKQVSARVLSATSEPRVVDTGEQSRDETVRAAQ